MTVRIGGDLIKTKSVDKVDWIRFRKQTEPIGKDREPVEKGQSWRANSLGKCRGLSRNVGFRSCVVHYKFSW